MSSGRSCGGRGRRSRGPAGGLAVTPLIRFPPCSCRCIQVPPFHKHPILTGPRLYVSEEGRAGWQPGLGGHLPGDTLRPGHVPPQVTPASALSEGKLASNKFLPKTSQPNVGNGDISVQCRLYSTDSQPCTCWQRNSTLPSCPHAPDVKARPGSGEPLSLCSSRILLI